MIEDLPNKVNNYIFIKYEDLINDFENTMTKIKNKGLNVKQKIDFPINHIYYSRSWMGSGIFQKNKNQLISTETILNNPNFNKYYEALLAYI